MEEVQQLTKETIIGIVNEEVKEYSNIDFPLIASIIDVGSQWNPLRVRRNKKTNTLLYGLLSISFQDAKEVAGNSFQTRDQLFDPVENTTWGIERLSRLVESSTNEKEAILNYFHGASDAAFRVESIVPIYRRAKLIAPTAAGIISMGAATNFGLLNKGMASFALLGTIFVVLTTVNMVFGTAEKLRKR